MFLPRRKVSLRRKLAFWGILLLTFLVSLVLFSGWIDLIFNPSFSRMIGVKWDHYHFYGEIVKTLKEINEYCPSLSELSSIGASHENRTIYCLRITDETVSAQKIKVLIVGYHHARERISAEVPLYFAVWLVQNYATNATVQQILKHTEIYFVVALNVDGFQTSMENPFQRKNSCPIDDDGDGLVDEDPPDDENGDGEIGILHYENGTFIRFEGVDDDGDGKRNEDWIGGVDLNRNYDFAWNLSDERHRNVSSNVFHGFSPLSEPETQAIKGLVEQVSFDYALSIHSGVKMVFYPWGYTEEPPADQEIFELLAGGLAEHAHAAYMQSSHFYKTYGDFVDWIYGKYGTLAFTVEVYGNSSAIRKVPGEIEGTYWEVGYFNYFNPPVEKIEAVCLEWKESFVWFLIEVMKR